jgi:lysophospholipase L1-like esterase
MNASRVVLLTATAWLVGISCLAHGQGNPGHWFNPQTAADRKPGTTVRIDLIGDSTQTENAGYGRGFCANLTVEADCLDMAKGGASTKTFREQGYWQRALATKPDYMVIQFGHNDMVTEEHLPRQVPLPDYSENLKRFVREARAAGITPVLVTPLVRRFWGPDAKVHSNLTAYSNAMTDVAHEMNVPLIDLHDESIAYLDKVGEAEGNTLAITKKDASGKTVFDETHLDWKGSYVFGRMVTEGLGRAVPNLAKYVRPTPADLPPRGVKAMQVINGAPIKIVLVGDSTVAPQGGWGPGLCAVMTPNVTCIDDALNGRSSKSFIDEGAWKRALAERGDYYLIQFGHNDEKPDAARHTDPDTTFADNLHRYIHDVQAIGAEAVIVSPLARRTFHDGKPWNEDLQRYADAARRVAEQEDVTFVDLLSMSNALLSKMTQAQADEFDAIGHSDLDAENDKSQLDRTHLNPEGQKVFGRMVADNVSRWLVELGPDVIGVPVSQMQSAQPGKENPGSSSVNREQNQQLAVTAYSDLPQAPFNPQLPTIYIVGDSTASYHPDPDHEGYAAGQGWGVFFSAFFDPDKVNVVNAAYGGRSSRTYITEGLWDRVRTILKPNDIVLIQLGQNDVFPVNDSARARGTLRGTGPETQEIDNMVTGKHETVHTFGWYLRQYIEDARAKGAIPVVLSLTPRNVWHDGHVEVGVDNYREWCYTVTLEEHHTDFVDVSALVAQQYEKLGQAKTLGLFHDDEPVHVDTAGAFMDSSIIVAGLKGLTDAPVNKYLSYLGERVVAAPPPTAPASLSRGQ